MRKFLIITALVLCLPASHLCHAKIKPGGKWVMYDVKIINKSSNPDFTYTPTSVTYKNRKSYSFIANRKGEDGKEHTISDEISVSLSWGAPPPVIKSTEEGKLEISYSLETAPALYQDKDYRRLRPTPGFGLDIRLRLTRVDGKLGYQNPEWIYMPDLPAWGSASGPAVPLVVSGEEYSYYGIDETDGKWQLVLRVIADFGGFDLEKYDEDKDWRSSYVIEHYYRYETDKVASKRVSAGGLSFDLDSDFTISERSPLNPGETLVIVPEGKRSANDRMFLILNTDVLSGVDVKEIPAERLSELMKTAAKKLFDTAADSYEITKKSDISYYMDGRYPTAYTEFSGRDAKGNPISCRVESKLVNGSVVSACSIASDKEMLSGMRGIYGKVVSAAADR